MPRPPPKPLAHANTISSLFDEGQRKQIHRGTKTSLHFGDWKVMAALKYIADMTIQHARPCGLKIINTEDSTTNNKIKSHHKQTRQKSGAKLPSALSNSHGEQPLENRARTHYLAVPFVLRGRRLLEDAELTKGCCRLHVVGHMVRARYHPWRLADKEVDDRLTLVNPPANASPAA
ncbi:hypothetical protein PG988_002567 [Apiospora saccharicola]